MPSRFTHLRQRIADLELLAGTVLDLARGIAEGKPLHSQLAEKGEEWYRGARSILVTNNFSGLADFDWCYKSYFMLEGKPQLVSWNIGYFIHQSPSTNLMSVKSSLSFFFQEMTKARALLKSCVAEVESREIPMRTELSLTVAADEFETADNLLQVSTEETMIRASGVVARVALERHLWTVANSRGVVVQKNPVHKPKPDVSDLLTALVKSTLITGIQRSKLDHLFKIGNNCAHPKEPVNLGDIQDLIRQGRDIASSIL